MSDSDLIVVGTLLSSEHLQGGPGFAEVASIRVRSVIWGDANVGDTLLAVRHYFGADEAWDPTPLYHGEWIWSLSNDDGDAEHPVQHIRRLRARLPPRLRRHRFRILSAHPQGVRAIAELAAIERAVARQVVVLRRAYGPFMSRDPKRVLIYRNPTSALRTYPGLEVHGSTLVLSPEIRMIVRNAGPNGSTIGPVVLPRAGSLVVRKGLHAFHLLPHSERRMYLDLKQLYDLDPRLMYRLQFSPGNGVPDFTHYFGIPQGPPLK